MTLLEEPKPESPTIQEIHKKVKIRNVYLSLDKLKLAKTCTVSYTLKVEKDNRPTAMLFVERNEKDQIIAVHKQATGKASERLAKDHREIQQFLNPEAPEALNKLATLDVEMVRVLEDLIEILIHKNVINFTDLPDDAQQKILLRKKIRDKLSQIL